MQITAAMPSSLSDDSLVPNPTAPALRQRLGQVRSRHAKLEGRRQIDAAQVEALTLRVATAKTRLGAADEVAEVLTEMQSRANSRAVGVFEKLLTAVLQDVLPEEGTVKLDLEMSGNNPALSVSLSKDGMVADVLEGTGGAVTNVVCTGLRFAALSRTANRKFLVLDEPDCWIKPEQIPAFMKVLADVATQTNTQTMFVSHHPPEFFAEGINIVQMSRTPEGEVIATAVEPIATKWGSGIDADGNDLDAVPGIRAIELENFMAHSHTVIPCFPGATAIVGQNNLGKSAALITGLKAVAFGESSDKVIKYGATKSKITVHIENNRRVVWTREPKRNPVVFFELWEGDTKVREGKPPARNQAPEWVSEALGIKRVDGLDLQLGNQKAPVFLLDQTASVRAQILSLGREGSHVLSLIKKWDEVKREDSATVRTQEPVIQGLLKLLEKFKALDEVQALLAANDEPLDALEAGEKAVCAISELLSRVSTLKSSVDKAQAEVDALSNLPAMPVLHEVTHLGQVVAVMGAAEKKLVAKTLPLPDVVAPELHEVDGLAAVVAKMGRAERVLVAKGLPMPAVEVPVLHDLSDLEDIANRWLHAEARLSGLEGAGGMPVLPAVPVLADVRELEALAGRFGNSERAVAGAQAELGLAESALAVAKAEFEALMDSLGGECPLCGHAHGAGEGDGGVTGAIGAGQPGTVRGDASHVH